MTKRKFTKEERRYRETMILNMAARVSAKFDSYADAPPQSSVERSRLRSLMAEIDGLVEVYSTRLPDKALEYFCGPAEVRKRDKLLGASGDVVPLKRNGRPLL